MIYKLYHLDWKDYDTKGKNYANAFSRRECLNEFESKYSDNNINDLNDEFRKDYQRENNFLLFISNRTDKFLEVSAAVSLDCINDTSVEDKLAESFPECVITNCRELTIDEFRIEIYNDRFYGGGKTAGLLNIDYRSSFFDPLPFEKTEEIYGLGTMTKAKCKRRAKQLLASKSMMEEIDRIYSKDNSKEYFGHPVQYLVSAGDWGAAMDMSKLLIGALMSNGRLLCGRQTMIRNIRKGAYKDERYRQVINAAEGGVVIIEMKGNPDIGNYATDFHELTKVTGEILKSQKKDTLFIFVEIMGESLKDSDALSNITTKADIIQIVEGTGTPQQARDYLKELVGKVEFAVDDRDEVFDYLPEQETYTVTDIYCAYNAWYGSGLKNHVYKAYKDKKSYKVEITPIESKPYEELQKLIGLKEIKAVVDDIIAAGKIKCMRERMGLKTEDSAMHMIYTGTPGTAKTTVARLLAQILKDENVIKSGRFIECGRQDLCGKYVGWTAQIVQEKFRAAQGGILFIDEAYSLVDDSNSYGAEAINTITQLMENYRDQVICIFAGYPDKMQEFLDQNEGLRSRIAFHLNFPDYSSEELVGILKLMCEKRQYDVSEDALEKCRDIFEQAGRIDNFGNGRYARNVLEQAILRQSSRIIDAAAASGEKLTREDVCRLEADDFKYVPLGDNTTSNRIGFAV